MQTTLRKMGNSTGLILPKAILDELGLVSGAKIDVTISEGKVVAAPLRRPVREGWEEAAKRIGAAGLTDEEQEWLDMPSDFDSEWEW
jgi:antitoxin MazE